ncbi:MAG TPA: hypothetical protein VMT03_25640 [Polyangia bacterium]|nr:hypothetical protein [Polyangia bacterium]
MLHRDLTCRTALLFGLLLWASACSSEGSADGYLAPVDPGPGGILFTASGQIPSIAGYAFPPASSGDPAFVDGWQIAFSRILVTFDEITLSEMPDLAAGDQSQTGKLVAEVDGPWAVDLAHRDSTDVEGEGPPGEVGVPITALNGQNLNGNRPFATDGTRYAFGFQVVAASATASAVNLDAAAATDYQQMTQDGCSVLYVGTATFKGGSVAGYTSCNAGHDGWPGTVSFHLCFKSPASFANCQNPENDPAAPLAGEDSQRGIAFLDSDSVTGQITMLPDQPFWDSVLPGSPAHFDQFAARVVGQAGQQTPTVTLEMTEGVDFAAYTDAQGNPISWRDCMPPPTDAHDAFSGPMAFDAEYVPRATNGDPATGLRDYYDFATYNQSTQWYLNEDGLCAVARNYPSPP